MADYMVNFWAILLAAVINIILGMLWYSRGFLGRRWIKAAELENTNYEENMKVTMLVSFISALIMAYILAIFVSFARATNIIDGATIGFWMWLGFIATTTIVSVIYERRSLELYLINNGYYLITLIIMGGILAIWP